MFFLFFAYFLGCHKNVQTKMVLEPNSQQEGYCVGFSATEQKLYPQQYSGKQNAMNGDTVITQITFPYYAKFSDISLKTTNKLSNANVSLRLLPTTQEKASGQNFEHKMQLPKISSNSLDSAERIDIDLFQNINLEQHRLRSEKKQNYVFEVEFFYSTENDQRLLIQQCETSGCEVTFDMNFKKDYSSRLQDVTRAIGKDFADINQFLEQQKPIASTDFSHHTSKLIDGIEKDYQHCLSSVEINDFQNVENTLNDLFSKVSNVWTIDKKKKVFNPISVQVELDNIRKFSKSNGFDAEFVSMVSAGKLPYFFDVYNTSNVLLEYSQKEPQSIYLQDNIGWASALLLNDSSFSTLSTKHVTLQEEVKQKNNAQTQTNDFNDMVIKVAKANIQRMSTLKQDISKKNSVLEIQLPSGVTLKRYSKYSFSGQNIATCYASQYQHIPSKNPSNDVHQITTAIFTNYQISNDTIEVTTPKEVSEIIAKVIDAEELLCTMDSITINIMLDSVSKTVSSMETLENLYDYALTWKESKEEIEDKLSTKQAIYEHIESQINSIFDIVAQRAHEIIMHPFKNLDEYSNRFCTSKSHELMFLLEPYLLAKHLSREKILEDITYHYSDMIKEMMLHDGVQSTLQSISKRQNGAYCQTVATNSPDVYFECFPKLTLNLSKTGDASCNQSKCTQFAKEVEDVKKLAAQNSCLNVVGTVVCGVPSKYPTSADISVEAPWRNTGTKQLGTSCFSCNTAEVVIKLNKQGYAGDSYYIYSENPFGVNGKTSTKGDCGTDTKNLPSSCFKQKVETVGDEYRFRLQAKTDSQCFYIKGI